MPKAESTSPPDWREQRRLRAWELHQQGWSQRAIAAEVGVTQGAVSQWIKRGRAGGIDALRRRSAPGHRRALTDDQLCQIPALLKRGAESFGFQGNHWTTRRVAVALRQVFGVAYHPAHISRLLRQCCPGWRSYKNV